MTEALTNCEFCNHPDREEMENKILKGKLTKRGAAEILNCRIDSVYKHMTEHMVTGKLVDTESKRNILIASVERLNQNLEKLTYQDNMSPAATKQLVQLAAEVRKTIMDLNALEGNTPAEQHITIEQYNDFRSVIIAKMLKMNKNLCPKCQNIWDDFVEELDEQPVIDIKA